MTGGGTEQPAGRHGERMETRAMLVVEAPHAQQDGPGRHRSVAPKRAAWYGTCNGTLTRVRGSMLAILADVDPT